MSNGLITPVVLSNMTTPYSVRREPSNTLGQLGYTFLGPPAESVKIGEYYHLIPTVLAQRIPVNKPGDPAFRVVSQPQTTQITQTFAPLNQ